jgi:choline-glycine betaine transporter
MVRGVTTRGGAGAILQLWCQHSTASKTACPRTGTPTVPMYLSSSCQQRFLTIFCFSFFYNSGIVIVSKPISFFFLIFITYKYGHIKFGKKHEVPEYSGITYFSMLFAAGVAVGIFYYGVSEPLWHQTSHWYANAGYRSQDEIDQFAMNQTIYHWGLHACT